MCEYITRFPLQVITATVTPPGVAPSMLLLNRGVADIVCNIK